MKPFVPVYVPVGVPTFHMESAQDAFERSAAALKAMDGDFVCPQEKLLSLDALRAYLDPLAPDLIVFQNLTFANAAYMAEVLRRTSCPVVLWTLREPVIDGGRLRLNSLTGAYSAANTLRAFSDRPFVYVFGAPEEDRVQEALKAAVAAARVKHDMRSLKLAAVGHTPQGFGFGRALDGELMDAFGVELETIEARELMDKAKGYTDEDCRPYLERTAALTCGFENTPERNRLDHARLYKAYSDYVQQSGVGALASRCWPDFFTAYGTPVCAVLSLLNDDGVAAACEADVYGALSMWVGRELSGRPVFFGDPVSLDEGENTITYWHCGAAACALARKDTARARSPIGTAGPPPAPWLGRTPAPRWASTPTGRSVRPWTSVAKLSPASPCSASAGNRTGPSASSSPRAKRWTSPSSSSAPASWSGPTPPAATWWRTASRPASSPTSP